MPIGKNGLRIRIGFSFTVLLVLTLSIIDSEYSYWCLLAAAVHELGHYLAMRCYGERLELVTLDFYGVNMRYREGTRLSFAKDVIVSISGPLMNFLAAGLLFLSYSYFGGEVWEYAFQTQLSLAVFNLLPIHQLDGGQILSTLLRKRLSLYLADRVTFWVSLFFAGVLGFCFLLFTMRETFNYSLLAVILYMAMNLYRFYC